MRIAAPLEMSWGSLYTHEILLCVLSNRMLPPFSMKVMKISAIFRPQHDMLQQHLANCLLTNLGRNLHMVQIPHMQYLPSFFLPFQGWHISDIENVLSPWIGLTYAS